MIHPNETFNGTWPFAPKFSTAPGFRMHYVDEGEGEVLVCLHGEPTWGYLYRNMIPYLSNHYRVIVPDHMGFGKSETPQDRSYTFQTHVENLSALLDDLGIEQFTFVVQDWGGPLAGAYSLRHPERIRRFCLMNTMLGYGGAVRDLPPSDPPPPPLQSSPWFQWVTGSHDDGTYRPTMENLKENVLDIMKRLYFSSHTEVDETWLAAYSQPFATKEECIAAVEFPLDAAYFRIKDYVIAGLKTGNLPKIRQIPAMLAEGMADQAMLPAMVIDDFKRLFPNGPVTPLEGVGHFCQEDAPETLSALIHQFIQMT